MEKFMSTGLRANRPANKIKKYISRAAAVLAGAGMFAGAVVFCISAGSGRVEEEAYPREEAQTEQAEQTDVMTYEETELPFVNRAFARAAGDYLEITVKADGKSIVVPAASGCTAADVLEKAGITAGENDELNVKMSDTFSSNSTITLNRVEYVEKTYTREYELDTEYIEDDSLSVGDSKVVTDGEKGELLVKVRAKLVDGEKVESEIISKEITVKAVRPVIAMGTLEVDSYSYAAGGDDENADRDEEESELISSRSEKYDTDSYEQSLSETEASAETEAPVKEEEPEPAETEAPQADDSDTATDYSSVWVRPEPEIVETEAEPEETAAPEPNGDGDGTVDGIATLSANEEGICLDGSRPVSRFSAEKVQLDENGVPVNYKEVHHGESCAYTAEEDALMSTGKTVFQGYVAVDPDIIPYGSELYIVADDGAVYGYAIAADTGYSVSKGHIIVDLFMEDLNDCLEWGRRDVTIYVL